MVSFNTNVGSNSDGKRFFALLPIPLLLISINVGICGQQRAKTRTANKASEDGKKAARARTVQKATALLDETAESVKSLDDLFYRARIEADIADAFWPIDPARSRTLFRRAWESATKSDESDQNDIAVPGDSNKRDNVTDARDELLARVAKRDPGLASSFLQQLTGARSRQKSQESEENVPANPWHDLPPEAARRLELAMALLDDGNAFQAMTIAQPLTTYGISADLAVFVIRLRERDSPGADAMLAQLIGSTGNNPASDANSVLLLSAPIFSPTLLVVSDAQGSLLFRTVAPRTAQGAGKAPIPPGLRNSFYEVSTSILIRKSQQLPAGSDSRSGVPYYFAIDRLLPFVEAEAPQFASLLKDRRDSLAAGIDSGNRTSLSAQASVQSLSPDKNGDPLRSQNEALSHASDTASRDRIALGIVIAAVRHRIWDRARRAASEISDTALQRGALGLIAVSEIADITRAYEDDKENDYESVLNYLGKTNAPPFAIAWGYAQAAPIAAKKSGPGRAAELVDEGSRIAAQETAGSRQRLAAYAVLATAASRYNKPRSWELVREVVRTANSIEDLRGDEDVIDLSDGLGGDAEKISINASAFRLDAVFAKMTVLDFDEALVQARAIERPIPRLLALTAIARSGIEGYKPASN